jgi:DNA polymerase-3 subunit alpha (Gram-positive type)
MKKKKEAPNFDAHRESYDLVRSLSFCVFDLETTGGNHKSDKIIEIGIVKVENLEIVKEVNYLIDPQMKIPEFIQRLTSISQEDVQGKPLIEDVLDEIIELMGDSILVAHNTSFDVPFFNSVLERAGKPLLKNKSLCTNLMTKYLIPNLLNSNLNYMSRIFDIRHKKAHRALDDAKAATELLINYLKIFIHKDIQKINHLYYPRNRYELDRIHYKEGTPNQVIIDKMASLQTPSLITLKGENGVILFALPCVNNEDEHKLLAKKLEENPWKMVSIKLAGPFIEALISFAGLFSKLDPILRGESIRFLWQQHLPGKKMPTHSNDNVQNTVEEVEAELAMDFGDFLIGHHLVPEQFVIYPVSSLHQKSQLIFRYPSHKKKLVQYINSKSSRLGSNKLKKTFFHPLLKDFIDAYLKEASGNNNSLFIFKKGLPVGKPEDFVRQLDEFVDKNPNTFNFPKEYI